MWLAYMGTINCVELRLSPDLVGMWWPQIPS